MNCSIGESNGEYIDLLLRPVPVSPAVSVTVVMLLDRSPQFTYNMQTSVQRN